MELYFYLTATNIKVRTLSNGMFQISFDTQQGKGAWNFRSETRAKQVLSELIRNNEVRVYSFGPDYKLNFQKPRI
jgi:hypothetical protein